MRDFFLWLWGYICALLPSRDDLIQRLVLTAVIAPLILYVGSVAWRGIVRFWNEADPRRKRLSRARHAVRSDKGVWLAPSGEPPADYENKIRLGRPVLTVGHLKGGVGKTTIAANLAAHFAASGERVLLIDLDFQGSLSSMALSDDFRHRFENGHSRASRLISGEVDADWLLANAWSSPHHARLYVIPAYYELARTENRLLVEWLIRDISERMPYFLADILTCEKVRIAYDRVVIDAPPRLTTSHVQALCASTHLLIPTVTDQLSLEAVGSYVQEVEVLKGAGLCPHLRYAGVLGTMMDPRVRRHEAVSNYLHDQLREVEVDNLPVLPEDTWIPRIPAISEAAGNAIAYFEPLDQKRVQERFDGLGREVSEAMARK